MDNFSRYTEYKDIGVNWIGEVPTHWKVLPFKALFQMSNEKNGKNVVGEMLSVSGYRGVEVKSYEYEEQKRTAKDLEEYRVVREGQLAVNTMWLNYTGLGVSEIEGHMSPAYRAYWISEGLHKRYIHYLMRSHIYVEGYTGMMQGVRPNSLQIKNVDFHRFPILVPDLTEQQRIADFLDQKTVEINKAIAKKQRLIKLLEERKAILINQAVTKGLNLDVPMWDSGVEWIGEIPEHWRVKRLKFISSVQSGLTLGKTYSGKNLISYPYLRVANVQYGYFDLDDVAEIRFPPKLSNQYLVQSGDILVTEGGDIDKLGRGTVWEGQIKNCLHQNHVFAIRVNKEVASEYFVSFALEADYGRHYFTRTANKTTNLASTNKSKLGNAPIALPPLPEQLLIVDYVNEIRQRIDEVKRTVKEEVDGMNELKRVFVSEAVTGKIKI